MSTSQSVAMQSGWWEPQEVPLGQMLCCRIGPLHLRLEHAAAEWRIASEHEDEAPDTSPPASLELASGYLSDDDIERYVAPRSGDEVRLQPMLPDRPVVIRPRQPVFLPSHAETTLYLSTPVWLRIEVGSAEPIVLREVPAIELSDTWFGPSTREGELCYSDKTRARSSLAEVPYRPHRVLTAVRVRNEAATVLPLEKLSLPVPALSVYGAADGSLHTQEVSLLRAADSDMATLKIEDRPGPAAGTVMRLSEARQSGRGGLVRAFSLLFGN